MDLGMYLGNWCLLAILWLPFCFLVGRMATSYQRSAVAWFLLAAVFTPVVAFIFLLVADVPHAAVVLREKEARAREQHPERADVRDIAVSELACPQCGATVNAATGDGLRSPEGEPWLLICSQCGAEIEP